MINELRNELTNELINKLTKKSTESIRSIKEQCKEELALAYINGICSTNTFRFLLNLLDEKENKDNKYGI